LIINILQIIFTYFYNKFIPKCKKNMRLLGTGAKEREINKYKNPYLSKYP